MDVLRGGVAEPLMRGAGRAPAVSFNLGDGQSPGWWNVLFWMVYFVHLSVMVVQRV